MHLGNAWAFLLAWLAARRRGGRVILRMEDIDTVRSRPEFADQLQRDLTWLGLDWDEGPHFQSQRLDRYHAALNSLAARGLIYPCYCTRKELRGLASAPHVGEAGPVYPGTCRGLSPAECAAREAEGRRPALRLHCPEQPVTFTDLQRGQIRIAPARLGDVALRRSDGVWAYQLAVVVDDLAMGVTQIVRGVDLLESTPWQVLLCQLLGGATPQYLHVPLLVDPAGERLAKRHGSLELAALREAGVRPEAITGWLGAQAGIMPAPEPCTPAELIGLFDPLRLPAGPVTTPANIAARLRLG
ncbi:tRNA glutamyl-Q(34) synthetase GluQRS [Megalodesulfovibrio paquesii]